jgi:putative ABC transport system permease protein
MLKNYLKVALRVFKRQKGYSFINILGLAVGMASCLLILLWVYDEASYDRYQKNADRIYRITYEEIIGGAYDHYAIPPFPAAPAFKEEIPEVAAFTRLMKRQGLFTFGEKKFEEEGIFYGENDFFRIFSHRFLAGNPDSALAEPNQLVLTESSARKIFGSQDPLGKSVNLNADGDLIVTGVIEDVPRNSHFKFDYLVSFSTLRQRIDPYLKNWFVILGWSYLLLEDGADPSVVEEKMNEVAQKHSGAEAREFGQQMAYHLQKVSDIHLKSHIQDEIEANGNIQYIYIFSIVAIFVLIIACINFVNLATARSARRGMEVGLRKVFGAQKKRLVGQFITESFFLSFLGLLLSIILVWLLLPVFNNFTGKEMSLADLNRGIVWIGFFALVIFTGLAAGSYPAFFLSSFQPIQVLRNRREGGRHKSFLRNGLVTFQFTVSVMLIIATVVVIHQTRYMKTANLGFDQEQVLAVQIRGQGIRNSFEAFKNTLKQNSSVLEAAYSNGIPGRVNNVYTIFQEGKDETVSHTFNVIFADYGFLGTYGIDLAQGRDFSPAFTSDIDGSFLINETAALKLGWGEETVGKKIGFSFEDLGPIVGITRDFHFKSVKEAVEPLAIRMRAEPDSFLSLKLKTDRLAETLSFVQKTWLQFEKDRDFRYFFVDENFDSLYQSEERLSRLISAFAFIAIFVACLGLFGLASYIVEQSTKEIGIRKILGASVASIVFLLSQNFTRWVLIGNVFAWPLSYLFMQKFWLSNFPSRIAISVWVFVAVGSVSLLVALLTVSLQSIKAALTNPADSLRAE